MAWQSTEIRRNKSNGEIRVCFQKSCFNQAKRYIYFYGSFIYILNLRIKWLFRETYCFLNCDSHLQCSTTHVVMHISLNEKLTEDVFPFRIFLEQESKLPHNSLSRCHCSLFVTVSVCRQHESSFSHSKPLSQIQNTHRTPYRLILRFLSINKGSVLPKFQ
jgi:hypothetical protein